MLKSIYFQSLYEYLVLLALVINPLSQVHIWDCPNLCPSATEGLVRETHIQSANQVILEVQCDLLTVPFLGIAPPLHFPCTEKHDVVLWWLHHHPVTAIIPQSQLTGPGWASSQIRPMTPFLGSFRLWIKRTRAFPGADTIHHKA